jgi:hypothetical protein
MNEAPFSNVMPGAEIVAGYQVIAKPHGGYTVRTPNGLHPVGEYSTLRQATMAAYAAAAVAEDERQRKADEQAAASAVEARRIARGVPMATAPRGLRL